MIFLLRELSNYACYHEHGSKLRSNVVTSVVNVKFALRCLRHGRHENPCLWDLQPGNKYCRVSYGVHVYQFFRPCENRGGCGFSYLALNSHLTHQELKLRMETRRKQRISISYSLLCLFHFFVPFLLSFSSSFFLFILSMYCLLFSHL